MRFQPHPPTDPHLRDLLEPRLGNVELGDLSTAMVREWRTALLDAGVSQSVTARSYRLLRAALNTAVHEDEIIARNPCRVRGADRETPAERPVLTVRQVFELADAMRYRRHRVVGRGSSSARPVACRGVDGERPRRCPAGHRRAPGDLRGRRTDALMSTSEADRRIADRMIALMDGVERDGDDPAGVPAPAR